MSRIETVIRITASVLDVVSASARSRDLLSENCYLRDALEKERLRIQALEYRLSVVEPELSQSKQTIQQLRDEVAELKKPRSRKT